MGRRYCSHNKNEPDGTGCVVFFLLLVFLMPLVGIWLLCSEDKDKQVVGVILLVIGIILWIASFAGN